jgi:1-acyl-sn-glycerol-3-phosphate acyltransferase
MKHTSLTIKMPVGVNVTEITLGNMPPFPEGHKFNVTFSYPLDYSNGSTPKRPFILPPGRKQKPTMSAAGRKRIAAAQRKRWAAQKAKQREAGKK